MKKLPAFNGEYIRMLTVDEFVAACRAVGRGPRAGRSREAFVALAPLVQERVKVLSEVPSYVEFFDAVPDVPDDLAKATKEPGAAGGARRGDRGLRGRRLDGRRAQGRARSASPRRHGLKLAKAQAPVRVAVTGRTVGPPLFESLEVLGRDETLARLRAARARL